MSNPAILAIDQGTTSSRAIVFTTDAQIVAVSQEEFPQIFPKAGWVEHDPEAIWQTTLKTSRAALAQAEAEGFEVVAIGITNQRETIMVWDRQTGKPIHPAIVWQDRRTAPRCAELAAAGQEALITERTGLLLDPYFSATKLAYILDEVPDARARAERGELAAGTVDTFLIWRLTGGAQHLTDATNASRTSLYNIGTGRWDPELLALFNVPAAVLPEVRDCASDFGQTAPDLLGRAIPISGVAGDQQAATIGQCGFSRGDLKSTYGTGCFVLLNTGTERLHSRSRLLGTVGYQLAGEVTYALEGSIFVAGAAVQWLRDGLKIVDQAPDTEPMASGLSSNHGVYLVPAFTGLGAPHWNPDARGAIYGLTRDTGRDHLARAALESVAYQTHDLFTAMASDGVSPGTLMVDGGMVANDWLCQFLADLLNVEVHRPQVMETTALGAAFLAGLSAGLYQGLDELSKRWQLDRSFATQMGTEDRQVLLAGWRDALERTLR
ncbi:MAG: glycerol kinase GlpK [Pseudomonadota bacterium]